MSQAPPPYPAQPWPGGNYTQQQAPVSPTPPPGYAVYYQYPTEPPGPPQQHYGQVVVVPGTPVITQEQPRHPPTFFGHMFLSCCVFWCFCSFPFSFVAFILARKWRNFTQVPQYSYLFQIYVLLFIS